MKIPLVSVICICYNHEKFLEESIISVINQSYENIEVFIIDDASTDGSWEIINRLKEQFPTLTISRNEQNRGNCQSFNRIFPLTSGKYILDLATDDVFEKDKIENQVTFFEQQQENVGVVHTNAFYINERGETLKKHFNDVVKDNPAQGEVFSTLLAKYNVCPPTMMIRRDVLEELNGYDKTLAYEDFDFWVRSARKWKYAYLDEIAVKKREVFGSLSASFQKNNGIHASTLKVCEKAAHMIKDGQERKALQQRINYELREAYRRNDKKYILAYSHMLKRLDLNKDWKTRLLSLVKKE